MNDTDKPMMDVPCPGGHEVQIPLEDMAKSATAYCPQCGKAIDIGTPEWQEKIDQAARFFGEVKPYR